MPTPPIMGLTSGMDTQKTIQSLLQLEREPLKRMEAEIQRDSGLVQGWEEVLKKSRILQDKSRLLYSFAGPFSTKRVLSSEPGAVTGEAAPRVDNIDQQLHVMTLATNEQIQSAALPAEQNLPAAKFQFGTGESMKSYDFPGGTPSAFQRFLSEKAGGDFDASIVRADDKTVYIVLRSLRSGTKGAFKFEDEGGLLRKMGLVKPGGAQEKEIAKGMTAGLPVREPTRENSGKTQASPDKSSVALAGREAARIFKGGLSAQSSVVLDAEAKAETVPGKGTPGTKESVTVGPEIKVDVSGVKLHGYDVDRTREAGEQPAPEVVPPAFGVGIVWTENGKQKSQEMKWDTIEKRHQTIEIGKVTGGKAADAVYVFVDQGSATFSGFKVVEMKPGTGLEAANVTQAAVDARIKMNGVEITRSSNTKLTDIIDGVSLTLNKTTAGLIHVTVQANSDDIVLRLKEWVAAYNDLLKFLRTNSSVEKKRFDWDTSGGNRDLAEGLRQVQASVGIFASDSNIRQLTAGLRSTTGSAYPSDTVPAYKVLADIGITTGEVGKDWDEIKAGYLFVDEDKLRRVLTTAPASVKELFASDSNDDNVPDNGVAFALTRFLEPYNRPTAGTIATRINLLKSQIADKKEGIRKKELTLKSTEENLRRKFGRMESAIRQSRAAGDQMRNTMRQAGAD